MMTIRIKQAGFWVMSHSSSVAYTPKKKMTIWCPRKDMLVWRLKVRAASGGGDSSSPNAASVEEDVDSSRQFAGRDDEYALDGKSTTSRDLRHPTLLGECESFKSISSSETKSVLTPANDSAFQQRGSSKNYLACKRNDEISPRVGGSKMRTRIEHGTRDDSVMPTPRSRPANITSLYNGTPAHSDRSDHGRKFEATGYSMKGNLSGNMSMGPNNVRPFDICHPHGRYSPRHDAYSSERDRLDEVMQTMEEFGQVLRPGMVLLKKYVAVPEQVRIVKECRELGVGLGGFYRPSFPNGAKMCLQMMCLGMNWDPVTGKYQDQRSFDGSKPPGVPHILSQLVVKAIEDAHKLISEDMPGKNPRDVLPVMFPDICIMNFYTTWGKLGLHQDCDETPDSIREGLPVVSLSIGDSAEFLYGDMRNVEEADRVVLESGDVLIFGGKARMVYHGVSSIYPKSAPKALLDETGLRPGRLNLTFRRF